MQPNKNFLPGTIKTIRGACASIPHSADNRIIINFTDINGTLESDFNKKLVKRWIKVNNDFRGWYRGQTNFKLGKILSISVQTDTEVMCMLVLNDGQLDLDALKDAMISAGRYALADKKNIHINKSDVECPTIEKMLNEYFVKSGVNVSIYEA